MKKLFIKQNPLENQNLRMKEKLRSRTKEKDKNIMILNAIIDKSKN